MLCCACRRTYVGVLKGHQISEFRHFGSSLRLWIVIPIDKIYVIRIKMTARCLVLSGGWLSAHYLAAEKLCYVAPPELALRKITFAAVCYCMAIDRALSTFSNFLFRCLCVRKKKRLRLDNLLSIPIKLSRWRSDGSRSYSYCQLNANRVTLKLICLFADFDFESQMMFFELLIWIEGDQYYYTFDDVRLIIISFSIFRFFRIDAISSWNNRQFDTETRKCPKRWVGNDFVRRHSVVLFSIDIAGVGGNARRETIERIHRFIT